MRSLTAALAAVSAAVLLAGCAAHAPDPSPRAAGATVAPGAARRPNIVLVLTDDLSMNLIARMPHVQAMQQAGRTMSRYYVTDSLCCPSRTSIFTGQYPHNSGVFTNQGPDGGYATYNRLGNPQRSFAPALHQAGYRTGFMGKYLNGYQPTDPVPPGWDEWDVAGNGYPEFDYDLNQNGTVRHYGHADADYLVDVLARKASKFIGDAADAKQPFVLQVATFAPHAPYTPAPRYAGADASVPYPRTAAYDTLPSPAPSWLAGRPPLTADQQRQIRTVYDKRLSADRAVDDLIGTVQQTLTDKGVAGDTYLVFTSDNGYHMGEYRLMPGKQTAYETDVHVPLVVTGPGVPAGSTSDALAENVDLAPTFETLAGAAVGEHVDGLDLSANWHGDAPDRWRRAVLVEHHGPNQAADDPDAQAADRGTPPSYEAVRTAGALYVRYASGEEEYYDTTGDPHELRNLARGGVPAALPRMLQALQTCQGSKECLAAAQP